MTRKQLDFKAQPDDVLVELQPGDTIHAGDFLEWMTDAFTPIDAGCPLDGAVHVSGRVLRIVPFVAFVEKMEGPPAGL